MFKKILIANRGEIACRVIRSARKAGIRSVAVYSDADRNALHVQEADEAVYIGGSAPAESYLSQTKIIAAAKLTGADAIHPGYGFLSENAEFCRLCGAENITFIGPPAQAIKAMGSKAAAKTIMAAAGVPLLPGYHGADQSAPLLKSAAEDIGYPVLLKAVAGGGGKGMRQVWDSKEFGEALLAARREALSSFGDDDMLVEKYLQQPRHVEVQVFFDTQGKGVYLFERDCSVQRRHQKIIEEAPAPGLSGELRERMGEAALSAARAVDYVGAGTVEFLLDASGNFYFMEMNTRLQVEHPVTEMITGQDLVDWQFRIASGDALPCSQSELEINGHAFEARIYAEDPTNEFLPTAGRIEWLQQPDNADGVRVDTGVASGDEVGVFYDPMIAKLIVWDEDRQRALQRLEVALAQYRIVGVKTNIDFLRRLCRHSAFAGGDLSTDFIPAHAAELFSAIDETRASLLPLACLYLCLERRANTYSGTDPTSPWNATDDWRMNARSMRDERIRVGEDEYALRVESCGDDSFIISDGHVSHSASGSLEADRMTAVLDGRRQTVQVIPCAEHIALFTDSASLTFHRVSNDTGIATNSDDGLGFKAPMNGTIVDVMVKVGDRVRAGDSLVIMEAMKMEHAIKAPADGLINELFFAKGDLVEGGADLLSFEAVTAD